MRLPYVPAIILLGMFLQEILEHVPKEICIGIFIKTFFVILKKKKEISLLTK